MDRLDPEGGHLEDIANLREPGLRGCHVDDLPRRERQEAALEALSNYRLKPQPVVYDDPDLKLITADSPNMRDE